MFGLIIILSGFLFCSDATNCPTPPKRNKVMHYHLHKTGGITINSILMDRYDGSQLHGAKRPKLSHALEKKNYYYISYVRDPVAALLSRFYFWRACATSTSSNTYHLEKSKIKKVMCQTQDSYMRNDASHNFMFDSLIVGQPLGKCKRNSSSMNFQTPPNLKQGATWKDVCPGGQSKDDFINEIEQVLWSLRDSVFIGITERFDESLFLFGLQAGFKLGIKDLTYCPKNLVVGGTKKNDLSETSLKIMESRNQLDNSLVIAAERVLERRIKCVGNEFNLKYENFKTNLHHYQMMNNCTMETLKTPSVNHKLKSKFKVVFLKEKLANPDYIDTKRRECK